MRVLTLNVFHYVFQAFELLITINVPNNQKGEYRLGLPRTTKPIYKSPSYRYRILWITFDSEKTRYEDLSPRFTTRASFAAINLTLEASLILLFGATSSSEHSDAPRFVSDFYKLS